MKTQALKSTVPSISNEGVKENKQNNKNQSNKSFRWVSLVTLLILMMTGKSSFATHVVGGGITYQQIESFNFLITVKLYRDCSPGTAQMPNSVNLQVRRGDGTLPANNVINLPQVSVNSLSPSIPACTFDPGICVEEGVFQAIVNMPPGVGGYHLYYTICCRNATVLNIVNPLNAQETFYAYMPDLNVELTNSSPSFNALPPVYVCAGNDLDLNFSATDPDGDSLVYSFYTPYDGTNGGGISYNAGTPPNNINISPVTWQPGFNATDPLDAGAGFLPGLTIDNTGQINGIPPAPGQYIVGVMVDEYRNGVLIGRITRDFQFNVLNCPPIPTAGIDVPNVCNGLNVDFVNTSVGATTYWWDFGTGNPADSSLTFQPSFTYGSQGTYQVTLITQKGTDCADTATYDLTIMNPVQFAVIPDSVNCLGNSDGSAAVVGAGNYSYLWSTNQTDTAIYNLGIGNYWVSGTNGIGCSDTQQFIIEEPSALDIIFIETPPLCNGDQNGSIEAIGIGGTAPYTYYWVNENVNGNILSGIGAGTYFAEATDANGCQVTLSGIVSEPTILNTALVTQQDASCFGINDGSAEISISGGSGSYTVDWLSLANDSTYMNGLGAGNYIVEVTDANNCLSSMVVTISEPAPMTLNLAIIQEETCTDANGIAFANVTGGIGVLNYVWTPVNANLPLATGLTAGDVSVVVTDENGCEARDTVSLVNYPTGTASVGSLTDVSCFNGNDGSVVINMTGGVGPFVYNWSCACPNSNSLSGLVAGTYAAEIVDNNGCVDSIQFTINQAPELSLDTILIIPPLCNGNSNGEAQVVANGGTAPYNYSWNTLPVQNSDHALNLGAGNYQVTVTDEHDCQETLDVQIIEPNVLVVATEVISNIICYGDSAGVASAQATGGTGPYSYYWNEPGVANDTVSNLLAGQYSVTVTDANGCQVSSAVSIIEYDDVVAEIVFDSVFCPGDVVSFYVNTNGMNNLYDYNWYLDGILAGTSNTFNTQIFNTTQINIDLVSQVNCPTISDSVIADPVMIDPGILSVTGTPDTICQGSEATIQATLLDWTYITSVTWNANLQGVGPHLVSPHNDYTYVITVENMCGQQIMDSTTINLFLPPVANLFADGTSGCDEVNAWFGFDYDAYDYSFQGASWNIQGQQYDELNPTVTFNGSADINAIAHLSFSNGCTFDYAQQIGITVWESPEANFYYNPDPAVQLELTELIDISHGNPQIWEWYLDGIYLSDEERPTHIFEDQGEYLVTEIVIDEHGCSDTIEHVVEVIGDFTVYVPNAFTPDGNGFNNNFRPIMSNIQEDDYQFLIYNRWGEIVFQTTDPYGEWDGTFNGDFVEDGVYVWKVLVRDNRDEKHEFVGHVTLLR